MNEKAPNSNKVKFGFFDYYSMYKKHGVKLPVRYFTENHLFDLVNGTSTHVWKPKVHAENIHNSYEYGSLYMSSWTSIIKNSTKIALLELHQMERPIRLVDIGCGKGKVMCVWQVMRLEQNRHKFFGFDYDSDLLAIAKKNLTKLNCGNFECYFEDALNIQRENTLIGDLYYLYNPFDSNVVKHLFAKLRRRKNIVIYNNPVHSEVLHQMGYIGIHSQNSWHPNGRFTIFKSQKM